MVKIAKKNITNITIRKRKFQVNYWVMCMPALIWLFFFQLVPIVGIIMAFQDYKPRKGLFGSEFIGFENFEYLFSLSEVWRIISNTVIIAVAKILLSLIVPLVFALLLNAVKNVGYKKIVQTLTYLPHFISWVILGGIIGSIFSYDGIFNTLTSFFGKAPEVWMGDAEFFRGMIIASDIWKGFGFGAIIYLAALAGVDIALYEAASLDGCNEWQKLWHITLPGISTTIVLIAVLSVGNVLNAGFDQILSMYNTMVLSSSDIIDTWVYRMGLIKMDFALSTAAGLVKSFFGMVLILVSYKLSSKFTDYKVF